MKSHTCDLPSDVVLIDCLSILFIKNFKISPVADIRKMLLMKDRSVLYELRAYLIYVKVGEPPILQGLAHDGLYFSHF